MMRPVRQCGDRLVCVRRRVDEKRMGRYVTVVVEETEMALPPSAVVGVRVQIDEPVLRQRVTATAGQWNPQAWVWEMPLVWRRPCCWKTES